ncbi:MAG: hypothetical protein JWM10_39 [Myxococcaceae bacterium]|nr:hypothetical protein [Myxococcaceae bacterium]
MPYRTPTFQPPTTPTSGAYARHDVIDRVIIRPLDQELGRAVLWALPLGVLLVPVWVGLLDLVR